MPEAQLDRFLLRVSIGHPAHDDEVELLRRRVTRRSDTIQLRPIIDADGVRRLQSGVETVHVGDDVLDYAVALTAATRRADAVEAGASARGSLALVKVARARAGLAGRSFVTPDDIKTIAVAALAHRIVLRPEAWVRGATATAVVEECLARVPTPLPLTTEDRRAAGP